MMLDQMGRRIPIVRNGRVIEIVSATDIVQLLLKLHDDPAVRGGRPVDQRTMRTE